MKSICGLGCCPYVEPYVEAMMPDWDCDICPYSIPYEKENKE